MSRRGPLRSHSTDDFFRRTPSTFSFDHYGSPRSSGAWDYPTGIYNHDSKLSRQYEDRYQKTSRWDDKQDTYFQRQPPKHVTWGAMPKYSADRDRLANQSGSEIYTESTYSGSHSPYRRSSESRCPIHGFSKQGQAMYSNLNNQDFEHKFYGSQSYPLNSKLYNSDTLNRNLSAGYNQSLSNSYVPSRYSSFSHLRNPFIDSDYYPYYGSFSRDQARSLLTSHSSFQRPKWRRSVIGLNRLSFYN